MAEKIKIKKLELSLVELNGKTFLCEFDDGTLTNAMDTHKNNLDEDMFATYLKLKNMGELHTRKCGTASSVSYRELDKKEMRILKMVLAEFEDAKEYSEAFLQNLTFDSLRGK